MNARRFLVLCAALLVANTGTPGYAGAQDSQIFLNSSVDLGSAIDAINRQSRSTKILLHHSVSANTPLEVRFEGVSFDQAIASIAAAQGLLAHREGNVVMLGPCDEFLREYNAAPPALYRPDERGNFVYGPDLVGVLSVEPRRLVFDVHAGDVEDIGAKLKAELPSCSLLTTDKRLGRIVVAGSRPTLLRAIALYSLIGGDLSDFDRVPVANQPATQIAGRVKASLPDGILLPDDNSRTILVSGPPALRQRAAALIRAVDVAVPKAWYDVWVVDYQPNQDSSNIGFQWGGKDLSGNITVGSAATAFSSFALPVNVTVNDVVTQTNSVVLAQTKLLSHNGRQEQWNVVDVQSYGVTDLRTGSVQREDVSAGLKLQVRSEIYNANHVQADLQLEYSDFIPSGNQFPSRTVRQIVMDPDLADGETVVMSGLMRDLDSTTLSKLPGFANLPIFGAFFRNKIKTKNHEQIVLFMTAHIVAAGDQGVPLSTLPSAVRPKVQQ